MATTPDKDQVQGEGDYDAGRRYDRASREFAESGKVEPAARDTTGYLGDIGGPYAGRMDFSAWFEVFLGDRWYTSDARHNVRRIGRIVMARGRDAGDVPITMCFGPSSLLRFDVVTDEVVDPAAAVAAA